MPLPVTLTKRQIEEVFNGSAYLYDRSGPSIFQRFGNRLASSMPLAAGMRVLDVATGTGAVLIPSARMASPNGNVVGIDISETILSRARREAEASGLANIELLRMDAEALDFPDGSFDAVTCVFALFMFPEMNRALEEMYRACRTGGYLGITYFSKSPPPFDPGWRVFAQLSTEYGVARRMPQQLGSTLEELNETVTKAGFTPIKSQVEDNDICYETFEDWWGFIMTLGSRNAVLSLDEANRERFKQDYQARLAALKQEDGFHMNTGVLYVVAQRRS